MTAQARPTLVHGGTVEVGQRWEYKPSRGGFGVFRVTAVEGDRVTLWRHGKSKTVNMRTLRSDYWRAERP
jgi:hypothetical protein